MFLGFEKTGNRVEDDSVFLDAIASYLLDSCEVSKEWVFVANLSNISALLYSYIDSINWVGFYLLEGDSLVLGPFQGEPACMIIKVGRGVCGTAAKEKHVINVPDVSKFPGHIACSSKSKSELVVPIIANDSLIGVIDIDSPVLNRFSKEDEELVVRVAQIVAERRY